MHQTCPGGRAVYQLTLVEVEDILFKVTSHNRLDNNNEVDTTVYQRLYTMIFATDINEPPTNIYLLLVPINFEICYFYYIMYVLFIFIDNWF